MAFRNFGHAKYHFEDEDFEREMPQHSVITHRSNAEELISQVPVIFSKRKVVRCTGVEGSGLGHPVQYIKLDRRHKHTPATCKYCGLRYQLKQSDE